MLILILDMYGIVNEHGLDKLAGALVWNFMCDSVLGYVVHM